MVVDPRRTSPRSAAPASPAIPIKATPQSNERNRMTCTLPVRNALDPQRSSGINLNGRLGPDAGWILACGKDHAQIGNKNRVGFNAVESDSGPPTELIRARKNETARAFCS